MEARGVNAENKIPKLVERKSTNTNSFPFRPVRHINSDGATVDQVATFVCARSHQPTLIFGETITGVEDGKLVGSDGERRNKPRHRQEHRLDKERGSFPA